MSQTFYLTGGSGKLYFEYSYKIVDMVFSFAADLDDDVYARFRDDALLFYSPDQAGLAVNLDKPPTQFSRSTVILALAAMMDCLFKYGDEWSKTERWMDVVGIPWSFLFNAIRDAKRAVESSNEETFTAGVV